jgi:hypothetical protein
MRGALCRNLKFYCKMPSRLKVSIPTDYLLFRTAYSGKVLVVFELNPFRVVIIWLAKGLPSFLAGVLGVVRF